VCVSVCLCCVCVLDARFEAKTKNLASLMKFGRKDTN
jgi:hypothetical protein